MNEKIETYVFSEEENAIVKNFTVFKNKKQIGGGYVGISDEELLNLYKTDADLAVKDPRLPMLLESEGTARTQPTQLDRIEEQLNALTAGSVAMATIETAILEGVNEV